MRKLTLFTFIMAVLGLLNVNAYAQSLYSAYDFSTDTVTVSGDFEDKKELVLFMILPADEKIENISENKIEENKYVTYQLRNGSDGKFEFSIQMPSNTSGGSYTVYAVCNGKKLTSEFSYINAGDVNQIVKDINNASATEIAKLLMEKNDVLGITPECLAHMDDIAAMVSKRRPTGGYNSYGFMDELSRCSAITLLKNSANTDDVMRSYGKSFGAEAQKEIQQMNSLQKQSFADYIAKNEADDDTKEFFYQSVLMSYIINAGSYADLKGIIDTYKEKSGLDADTAKLSVDAYKQLFNAEITTFGKLESTIKSLYNDKEDNNGGSGGSGGGGGGGGVMLPSVSSGNENIIQKQEAPYETKNEYDKYADIKGHWCAQTIIRLSDKGIVSGYSDATFRPDKSVTRAEFVKLIVSALNIEKGDISQFEDVNASDWHFEYVAAGVKAGIINGYGDKFRPNDEIKRQDAAVIIYRALGLDLASQVVLDYVDAGEIAQYATEAVSGLSRIKILNGDGAGFLPNKSTTRAEAAVMIEKMLEFAETVEVEG